MGCLQAKYPFKKDPAILVNNGKEAKSCQISQERRQLKNSTHSQYVKQFRDMVERNVISELTQAEMSAYTGPINYITHHDVYKPGWMMEPCWTTSYMPSGTSRDTCSCPSEQGLPSSSRPPHGFHLLANYSYQRQQPPDSGGQLAGIRSISN